MGDWRKSTYSSANGGQCVEAASRNGVVLIRDTIDRDGAVLGFSAQAWAAFAASLRQSA
jgi:hypothetical protein